MKIFIRYSHVDSIDLIGQNSKDYASYFIDYDQNKNHSFYILSLLVFHDTPSSQQILFFDDDRIFIFSLDFEP